MITKSKVRLIFTDRYSRKRVGWVESFWLQFSLGQLFDHNFWSWRVRKWKNFHMRLPDSLLLDMAQCLGLQWQPGKQWSTLRFAWGFDRCPFCFLGKKEIYTILDWLCLSCYKNLRKLGLRAYSRLIFSWTAQGLAAPREGFLQTAGIQGLSRPEEVDLEWITTTFEGYICIYIYA